MTNDEKLAAAMAWYDSGSEDRASFQALMEALLAQPEQEPVAWANKDDLQNFDMRVRTNCDLMHTVPLYTAPPQRETQYASATDEEIEAWAERHDIKGVSTDLRCMFEDAQTLLPPPQRKPLTEEFGIQEYVDIGQYSLQVIFKDRLSADRFKAHHGIKGEA